MADFKERVCRPKDEVEVDKSNLIVDLASTHSKDSNVKNMIKNEEELKNELIFEKPKQAFIKSE